ncbi:SDR family NAD(P)-dependent oxidoreductase [Nonomuraea sp. NPDC003201]
MGRGRAPDRRHPPRQPLTAHQPRPSWKHSSPTPVCSRSPRTTRTTRPPRGSSPRPSRSSGRLDILINNAQEFRTGIALEDLSWDDMISTYESGVFATWRFMAAALPYLKETEGTVNVMGSGAGVQSVPHHGAYGSNKEANEREYPDVIADIPKGIALGRIGDAEKNVGSLCVYLAKPEGKYMTGSTFDVDGGAFIRP